MNLLISFSHTSLHLLKFSFISFRNIWSFSPCLLLFKHFFSNAFFKKFFGCNYRSVDKILKSIFWKRSFYLFIFLSLPFFCQVIFLSFLFWQCHETCEILAPWPGLVPRLLAVKMRSPNHWTSRELLQAIFLDMFTLTFSGSKI